MREETAQRGDANTVRAASRGRRPLPRGILLLVAGSASLLAGFVFLATALGFGQADVRGVVLEGAFELLFLAGIGLAAAAAGVATVGLASDRNWAVWLLAAVWPGFALVCLALDRWVPAPGPGRPLAFYLLLIGALPACLTFLLGRWRS